MLERLEPLYRYFKSMPDGDPIANIMMDMEQLAKGNYIKSVANGHIQLKSTPDIEREVRAILAEQIPPETLLHMMFQNIGEKMFISLSRVTQDASKTALALCINEDDTVTVDFLEHAALFNGKLNGKTLWNSISTVVVQEDGSIKRGFIRVETTFAHVREASSNIGIKCDFKVARSTPFYIYLTNCDTARPLAMTGADAKSAYERMAATWTS